MTRRYVGQSVLRVEDATLTTGRGSFVADVRREGQLWARVVRSPVPHGRIVSVHTEGARQLPGVVDVITAVDLPEVRIPIRMAWTYTDEANRATQPPLATDRVRYVGEPFAVVVAIDPYVAEDAADEIWVEVEELEAVLDVRRAADPELPVIHPDVGSNVINCVTLGDGDVEAVFARADLVVREQLGIHRHTAAPMETRGLVAEFDAATGRLTVWGAAKVKHFNRSTLSALLGLPEERIRFVEGNVGGGFGVRGEFYPEDFLIPFLALRVGRPVKWVEDRSEHFVATNHSREGEYDIEVAAGLDGSLLAFRSRIWSSQGGYIRTHGIAMALLPAWHLPGPYAWEAFEIEANSVCTNKTPTGTYRGPGIVEAAFVRERMIDRIAVELGLDPAELRTRNFIPREQMPFRLDFGENSLPMVYDSGDYLLFWTRLLEEGDYAGLRREQAERRARGETVGVGVAAFVEVGSVGPYEQARVVPERDGTFTLHVGVASVGQGVQTALGQIAADELGVAFERIRISHHDTDEIPEGFGAFASRATVFGGNAIALAVRDLYARALPAAAQALSAPMHQLEVAASVVRVSDDGRSISLAELGCVGEGKFEKEQPSVSFGCNLALVSVEPRTGRVKVLRLVVAYDVGRAVNPMLLGGQLAGAAAQGIAGALFEELVYSEEGHPLSTSFMDYLMPTLAELPDVQIIILEYPVDGNPLGLKGGGEGGINGTPASIGNAVADALGVAGSAVTRLPLTPNAVRGLMRARASS